MSQNNAKTNANPVSETNNKKISNNDSVIQLAVIQPRYNTNSNTTTLSQEEEKNSLEKSHSKYL